MTAICDKLKGADLFAKNISLTHNGQEKFQSRLGGILSIVIYVILFAFAIFLLARPRKVREDVTVVEQNETIINQETESGTNSIGSGGTLS